MKNIKYWIFEKLTSLQSKKTEAIQLKKENVKSVLLIRQDNRIGNILFITSLINLINQELGIKPDVILGEKFNGILEGNPNVNKIIVYSQKKFLKNPILFFKFMKNMKEKQYDLIIDCKNVFSFNNAIITLMAQGNVKVGFKNLYSDRYLNYAIDTAKLANLHESEYLAAPFLEYFKIGTKVPKMSYYLKPEEKQEINATTTGRKQVGIHIGGRGEKSLNIELINEIVSKFIDCDISIIYGPDEVEKVKFIKNDGNIKKVFPKSINDLAVLINSLNIFITPDTGPLHIASALNKNIVAVFTGDSFDRYGPRTEREALCINTSKEPKAIIVREIAEFINKVS